MTRRRLLEIGLGLLLIGGVVASLMVYYSEKLSRRESEWRNRQSRWFQEDFKPWTK